MVRTITCRCGYQLQGTDEELFSLVRRHVDPCHPEKHGALQGKARQSTSEKRRAGIVRRAKHATLAR